MYSAKGRKVILRIMKVVAVLVIFGMIGFTLIALFR
jgi:hypothetical protein